MWKRIWSTCVSYLEDQISFFDEICRVSATRVTADFLDFTSAIISNVGLISCKYVSSLFVKQQKFDDTTNYVARNSKLTNSTCDSAQFSENDQSTIIKRETNFGLKDLLYETYSGHPQNQEKEVTHKHQTWMSV